MMRIGIVGVGAMGSTHAAAWAELGVPIAGFVATTPEHAQPLAERYGASVYPDLASLLSACDVVDICTPTHLHHPMVVQAARAGKDIICEKPLARTLDEGRDMIRTCREAGVRLLVGHVVRFFPEYVRAREAVKAGQVGQVAVVRLQRDVFRPRKAQDNWFLDVEKSGGMILDLMIHDFDYARWVAGEVETVFCQHIGDPSISPGDHALAILRHRHGAITHVEGSWAYPPPTFRTRFEIAGADGLLIHDTATTAPLAVFRHQAAGDEAGEVPVPASPLLESPYTTQLKAFYRHLMYGDPIPVTAADALAALQIALAAITSTQTGAPVSLTPLPEVEA
ncbi:MAG: Gfo/Idh/MocA family oxidoreductase [Anaerolineae bacterium]|nr:Gfo/Idh/MocA family oxidoreductase [Caldilineales bacterium]MDW8269717.1 Gfo/Idh/MocA family oxidoreductase [Anaerolineae bacterium]